MRNHWRVRARRIESLSNGEVVLGDWFMVTISMDQESGLLSTFDRLMAERVAQYHQECYPCIAEVVEA